MARLAAKLLRDDRGLETVEYAIIAGLIVAVSVGMISAIGSWVSTQFNRLPH